MTENLIIGIATTAFCLIIQCSILGLLLQLLFVLDRKLGKRPTLVEGSSILVLVMLTMLAGNLLQMFLWAGIFVFLGEFIAFDDAFYHSVVNFSTLGYGDWVMSDERRLLGAIEAVNGILMFGLSTGFLFMLLHEFLQNAWDVRIEKHGLKTDD